MMSQNNRILSAEGIGMIHEKVLAYLSERGVLVQHSGVLKKLSTLGADVDFQAERVRFPQKLVGELLGEAPRTFTLAADDSRLDLKLPSEANRFYVCTNTGARNVIDPATDARRAVTKADIKRWGRLVESLDNIQMCAVPTPTDVPPETACVHGLEALLASTRKHIWVQPHSQETLPYLFDLAIARSGGGDRLNNRPCVSFIADSLTPLQFKPMDIEVILQACRLGVPVHACSLPASGGTAPITSVGTVILAGIEVLTLVLIAQAVRPGTPVVGLATSYAMDMHSGMALKANVKAIRTNAAAARFIKQAFGIPAHTCGMTTDSALADDQSLAERCLGGMMLARSGVDIMGRAGEIEAAKTISPAQLVVDSELAAMIKHLIDPITVDENTMAWQDLLAVAPGDHFLDKPSTLANVRKAFRPALFKRGADEASESEGVQGLLERARQEALEVWEAPPDGDWPAGDILKEMNRIVREADRALAGKG